MVTIRIYTDRATGCYTGFESEGHAEFADSGKDVICSAISVLTINTINSIEEIAKASLKYETLQKNGVIRMTINDLSNHDAQLFMQSFELGLKGIVKSYGNSYLKVLKQEV